MSALVVVLAQVLALRAGDAPPAPSPVVQAPVEQPVVEAPAVPAPVDEEPSEHDDAPAPDKASKEGAVAPDGKADDDDWSMVNTLGATGCAVGGVLPAMSAVTAMALFYGGTACSSAGAAVGGVSGVVIGVPALIALAPCAVGGVACGAAVGAVLDDEEPGVAAAWTLPGLVVGTAGGALAAAGLVVASDSDSFAAGTAMVAVGSLLALSGGPLAIAGASLTRTPAVPEADEDKALDDDNAVDVVFVPAGPMRF